MIDWSKQICGVHQASWNQLNYEMSDVADLILEAFPENPLDFVWDVKVHMLMPSQWPCIPNWHYDNVPRVNNKQDFDKLNLDAPMYVYISNEPLTEFRKTGKVKAGTWHRFTQEDEHRGTMSEKFQWRGFIRATHKDISPVIKKGHNPVRVHSQVYLDVNNFSW
tara:strand:+ start:521 stop:1012 length:492 start_codon:yes stop_codon:yes gene_type:complete